ncbi:transporter substrate-binding domain-containing protein [Arthrobacter sp. zg-Y820]|uniref:transporter substrate-binding domain-containing protein n=1 Tax=unclassified Arthrobacter TaxID=235627 RepID=UPI001E601357|nr:MULTISPECIES: transporter substrate-binding domain-containing protein [unclassified Arthrobacter]MCC9195684.1 transporter substrate-binding domain-containing protein [Arthrobacter sp. zg-Y820]MDK1278543.1 transporter substrate-binding domain-containing protein [Arthrobacter sp. zg.Y820]WIB09021.1 transporter substrate-binding domain-containing protein [Arthrobacter sp. zg-Y820]
MLTKARRTALAAVTLGALALTACGGDDSSSESGANSGLGLVSEGTLTVCSEIPYVPFEYVEDGEYTGFDIDLIREVATGMGLEMEIQQQGFEAIQGGTAVTAGMCDLSASAVTITPERADKLLFSDPYYDSLQTLMVPKGSDIQGIEDLAGKRVGVQQSTTGAAYAQENVQDAEIIEYPGDGELFQAIQGESVDAVLQDIAVNTAHTADGDFDIVEEYETDESYGFATKKENTALIEEINTQLTELRDNGKYQEIYDKYFAE